MRPVRRIPSRLPGTQSRDRRRPLLVACLVVSVGMMTSLLFHGAQAIYLGRGYPYSTFLFRPDDRFMDFFNDVHYALAFGHAHDMVAYSAPVMAFLRLAGQMPADVCYILLASTFILVLIALVYRYGTTALDSRLQRVQYTVILGVFTYPTLFILDRGNLDLLVFIALAAFVYYHVMRRWPWSWVFLAVAIAAKYYPAVFLVLLVVERRFRDAVYAIAGAVVLTILSALALGAASGQGVLGSLCAVGRQLARHDAYSQGVASMQHAHSLWGLTRWLLGTLDGSWLVAWRDLPAASSVSRWYLTVALLVFALIVIYLFRVETVTWRRVALLTLAMVLLPYESHDYTLVFLYLPLVLLLLSTRGSRTDVVCAALLAVPLIPLDYYYFGDTDVSVSIIVYPLVLVAAGAVMVFQGLRDRDIARTAADTTIPTNVEPAPAARHR